MIKFGIQNKLHHKLLAIATPIIIQNLVLYFQIQVDMAMVGQASSLFLSAIANVLYPYNIVIAFLTSLTTGATVVISHSFGGNSLRSAKRFSEVSFVFNFIFSIPFFLILYMFASTLLVWMGTTEEVNTYGTQYLKSLSFSVLFLGISLSISAILLAIGKTTYLMTAAIITTVTNIFFDWTLIYGNLHFQELGIQGAGIATSAANFAGMAYLVISYIFSKDLPFKSNIKGVINTRWSIQKRSIIVGLPFGLEAMLWSLGQLILIRMINSVDEIAAGIYVLIIRIQSVTFFFYLGIARATMILIGQQVGARKPKGAIYVFNLSLKYALTTCVIASFTFLIFPDEIISIFTNDSAVIERSARLLIIVAFTIFPVSINVISGNGIRGLKDTKWMFYTQTFGTIFVITVSAFLLFYYNLGLIGVIITVLLDEIIRAMLNYGRFRSHKYLRTIKP